MKSKKVKKDFHALVLKKFSFCLIFLTILFFQNTELICATYKADYIPWSGSWWPKIHGGLVTGSGYSGHPAPFEKYDYVTTGDYYGPATRYGWEHHYDKEARSWEGLCFCWAAASILEEEPTHKGVYKGTVFRVGDKKGLLTAVYFGTLYNTYPTDKPEDFHQVLENFIAIQKTPVIMDLGTGGESWNYPIFKYDTDYTREGNVRHYTTTVYYADDQVEPDYVGTKTVDRTYYYYFISDKDGNILESGWENGSISPVNATEPFGTEPLNPGLDYDLVKEIANTVDDPFKGNDSFETASSLSNGHHKLIAINSDYFKAELKRGDKLSIRVAVEDSAYTTDEKDVYLRTYTPEGELIQETLGNGEQTVTADDREGTFFFEIAPVKASEEPVCDLFFQHHLTYQGIFLVNPPGQWSSGIALLNPYDNNIGRIIISLADRHGFPRKSYSNNLPRDYLLGVIENTFGLFPPTGTGYIKVDSDVPLMGLQVATPGGNLMLGSNFIPSDKARAEIFFPYLGIRGIWANQTALGIINVGDQTEEILWESYDQDGLFLDSDTTELTPGQKMEDDSISILSSDAKTIRAAAASARKSLTGYIKYQTSSYVPKGRSLVPLAPERGGVIVVPHVVSNEYWRTDIAVINIGEEDSTVLFSAFDGEGNLLDVSEHILRAKQNFANEISDIFSGMSSEEIASVKIISQNNQPLSGVLFYGTTDEIRLAGLPLGPAASSSLYLPHVAYLDLWWTGIGVMNAGDVPTDISFSLFNSDNDIISVVTKSLNPNQRLSNSMRGLFGDDISPAAKYMKAESAEGQPISGVYVMGTNDGLRMMGATLNNGGW